MNVLQRLKKIFLFDKSGSVSTQKHLGIFSVGRFKIGLVMLGIILASTFGAFTLPHLAHATGNMAASAAGANDPTLSPGSRLDCGFLEWSCLAGKAFYFLIYNTLGVLVGVAAWFLDKTIDIGIFGFASFVDQASGIVLAWQIFRDLITVTLIFALLYAAIRMILGLGKYEGIIKGVIIAGLFINFTFFLTSVVIDASNVLTVELKKAVDRISDVGDAGVAGGVLDSEHARTTGITAVFMQNLKLSTIPESALEGTGKEMDTHVFQNILFTSILLLIVAIVFFTMGLLFFTRFVTLIIILITSPIAVVGGLFPQLNSYSQKWRKVLVGQAIFAPLMMLCILIAVMVMTSAAQVPLLQGDLVSPDGIPYATGFSNLLNYAVVIGLLIGSIIIAQSNAGPLAQGLTNWAEKKTKAIAFAPRRFAQASAQRTGKFVGDTGKSVAGTVGRNTIGLGARKLGNFYDAKMGAWTADGSSQNKRAAAKALMFTGIDRGVRERLRGAEDAKYGSNANIADKEKYRKKRIKETLEAAQQSEVEREIKKKRDQEIQRRANIDNEIKDLETKHEAAKAVLKNGALTNEQREEARNERDALAQKIREAQEFKAAAATTGLKTEENARWDLSNAAKNVPAEEIGAIEPVLDDIEKEIKEIRDADQRQAKRKELYQKRLSDEQRRYYEALQELTRIEKDKGDLEKSIKKRQAAVSANARGVFGADAVERAVVDEMRKDKNAQKKMMEAIKKAISEDKIDIGGDEGAKPEESGSKPGTGGDNTNPPAAGNTGTTT